MRGRYIRTGGGGILAGYLLLLTVWYSYIMLQSVHSVLCLTVKLNKLFKIDNLDPLQTPFYFMDQFLVFGTAPPLPTLNSYYKVKLIIRQEYK